MKPTDCYIPIKCSERMPTENGHYFIFNERTGGSDKAIFYNGDFINHLLDKVTHWLEKKENVYVLDEKGIEKIINDYLEIPGKWNCPR